MNKITELLRQHPQVTDYKINIRRKESYELFFVKGALETVRATDNTDKEVTVYADHGAYKGHAQFFVYPSTTEEQLKERIEEAAQKALLIDNQTYGLPSAESGEYEVESNFTDYDTADLAAKIANAVFGASGVENATLNAVEIFVNKHTETVRNSRGLHKTQTRYSAMVEAIPTYTADGESVELYEQYNFSSLDEAALHAEIAEKMSQVKARFEAKKPEISGSPKVILNGQELAELAWTIADNLDCASVYSHYNVFSKGDAIQKSPTGDRLGVTMAGGVPGSARSSRFDSDGLTLTEVRIIDGGRAVNYYGANRFSQYLGEKPTGVMPCIRLDPGTAEASEFAEGPYLEIISMSGLQADFFSDYLGGEIRLAYWHDGETVCPVTGVSVSGKLSEVLETIRFSKETTLQGSYYGPAKAIMTGMNIF